jgi:hypothetical protein
VPPALIVQE